MKRWRKWIDAIFSIALFLTIICSYFLIFDYGKITARLMSYHSQPWFFYFLTIVSILAALLALYILIRALALPTTNNYLVDKDKSGEMLITSKAMENHVLTSANRHPEVKNSKAFVKVNNGKQHEITAKVVCGVYEGDDLNALGSSIQKDVADGLEAFTGYPVKKVDVEFYDIKKDSKKRVV